MPSLTREEDAKIQPMATLLRQKRLQFTLVWAHQEKRRKQHDLEKNDANCSTGNRRGGPDEDGSKTPGKERPFMNEGKQTVLEHDGEEWPTKMRNSQKMRK